MQSFHERLEEVFHAAVELSGQELEEYLTSSCRGDHELRRRVEALLNSDAGENHRLPLSDASSLPDASKQDLLIGRKLGPYLLQERLAVGGMGAVYKAFQENPKRQVAVKVLRMNSLNAESQRRFVYEGQLLGRLNHRGIATVHEVGQSKVDGTAVRWIAMELVDGGLSLYQFAQEEHLALKDRIKLFTEVCLAVHFGHQRGVIHRDLKPANILVGSHGQPKLIDFGVARTLDAELITMQTKTGTWLGTLAYMSPEQCVDAAALDVRSDVYSLGVVLYELLCGCLPYDLEHVPLLQAARIIQEQDPRPPSMVRAEYRGSLQTILLKSLEKDPERRYQSAQDLAADLGRFLENRPIKARPQGILYRLRLALIRYKALVAFFLVLLLATTVTARFAWQENRARVQADRQADRANLAAADLAIRQKDVATAGQRLREIPPRRRQWEWNYLNQQLDLADQVILGPLQRCESLVASDTQIAGGWHYPKGGRITVWNREDLNLLWDIPVPHAVTRLSFTQNGTIVWGTPTGSLWRGDPRTGSVSKWVKAHADLVMGVAVAFDGSVISASVDGTVCRTINQSTEVLLHDEESWKDLALSKDGKQIAVCGEKGAVYVLSLVSGSQVWWDPNPYGEALAVAFSADAKRLAVGYANGQVRSWHPKSGTHRTWQAHESRVLDLIYAPDNALVTASEDRTLRIWNQADEERKVLWGHTHAVKSLAVSSLGDQIYSGGYDGTMRVWHPEARAGGSPLPQGLGARDLAFTKDSQWLAAAGLNGQIKIYDTSTWQSKTMTSYRQRATAVAFHPSESVLASAAIFSDVHLWNTQTGRLLRTIQGFEGHVITMDYAVNGKWLAVGSQDGFARLFETSSYSKVRHFEHGGKVEQIAFDAMNSKLATMTENSGKLRLWDLQTGQSVWTLVSEIRMQDICFSPDGKSLAVAVGEVDGLDAAIHLYTTRDGARIGTLKGHSDFVLSVEYSRDGNRLFSSAGDGTIRIWDVLARKELLTLRGHAGWVWCTALSKEGMLASTSGTAESGSIRIWDGRKR